MDASVHYELLRDGLDWEGDRSALAIQDDGSLTLVRVPAPSEGNEIAVDGPYDAEPSGIAARRNEVFVSDTESDSLIFGRTDCSFTYTVASAASNSSEVSSPAGLALHGDCLYVADSGNARVQCFQLPAMELRRSLAQGLSQPTNVAVDRLNRVYVLDRGSNRVVRFNANGTLDNQYHPTTTKPLFCALSDDDVLFVSDASSSAVTAFDASGASVQALALPARTPAVRPGALAFFNAQVLVADTASGSILVFDHTTRKYLGEVPNVRTPVSAMAFDANGDLLVKSDGSDTYSRLVASGGCVASGTLIVGPLDAGELSDWERVVVSTDLPDDVSLETFVQARSDPVRQASNWILVPSVDCLLNRDPGPTPSTSATRRYLWLRVTVQSADAHTSPALSQIQAQTTGVSLIEKLPRIYRRDDKDKRFLERWLALFRSSLETRDDKIDFLFRSFDPATAPADSLQRLASMLAFDPPANLSWTQLRKLLERVPQLYAQRGTIAGLQMLAEIYSGFQPKIVEAYRARRVWELGETSLLGFDTALAAATPEGLIVPHDSLTDPNYAGLQGDYYRGSDFAELIRSQTDATIAFQYLNLPAQAGGNISPFTVRWSGQLKPRYSETHLISLDHQDGARLWIDGQQIVDSFKGADPGSFQARVPLDADRWHSIQLDIRSYSPTTKVVLSWASRRQQSEAIPSVCLYSLFDEHADLSAKQSTFDVGSAVVGESRPQAASEFGTTLSSDFAHLFTVIAPAGCCNKAEERRALRDLIDAEKPAYTDYHLCFIEPRMRVGFQARLGIDSIVATPPPGGRLDATLLDSTSYLADAPPGGARVGARARVGLDTVTC